MVIAPWRCAPPSGLSRKRGAVLIYAPHASCDAVGIAANPVALEVPAYVGEIAMEQVARTGVEARVDRLREIDDGNRAVPVEDVVGRQIAVDAIEIEPQPHVAQDAFEQWLRLLARELALREPG